MNLLSNTGIHSPYHPNRTVLSEVTVILDMYDCDYGCINYKTVLTAAYVFDQGYRASRDEPGEAPSVDIQLIKVVDHFGDATEPWSKARIEALIWDDPMMMKILRGEALKAEGVL